MSIKYKLTLVFAAALVLATFAAIFAVRATVELQARKEIEQKLAMSTRQIEDELSKHLVLHRILTHQDAVTAVRYALANRERPLAVVLEYESWLQSFRFRLDEYGQVYDLEDQPEPAALQRRSVLSLRKEAATSVGTLTLSVYYSLEPAQRVGRLVNQTFMLVQVVLLPILLVIGHILFRRLVSEPLEELARLNARVALGELDASASRTLLERTDEVGRLAESFQRMLDALRKAREENRTLVDQLQGFNQELKVRVQDATQTLEEKSNALIEARESAARQERLAALGQLAGNIAHEIGTPLGTLSGYLQLVMAEPNLSQEVQESLRVAQGEAQRVTSIIRRFLATTRGLRPVREAVAVEPFLESVVELAMPPQQRHGIQLELKLEGDLDGAQLDPGLVRQVLSNLIRNAFDAMGGTGTLTLRAAREGPCLVLEVEDSGPGIEPTQRAQVFEPFYTTKGSDVGSGLGLAISREIVHALKGSLHVKDPLVGTGARLVMRLPAFDGAGIGA